jgi:hypothetical protein
MTAARQGPTAVANHAWSGLDLSLAGQLLHAPFRILAGESYPTRKRVLWRESAHCPCRSSWGDCVKHHLIVYRRLWMVVRIAA